MARPYRLQSENCLYHIMSRGDDRKKIYTRAGDYGKFMDYVVKAKERDQNDSFEFRGLTPYAGRKELEEDRTKRPRHYISLLERWSKNMLLKLQSYKGTPGN